MALPGSFIDELIDRSDIVDVVSDYVQLNRKGGNYFGLCPFHSEKTASFSVSGDKQIYHCFGCGKGGGVINFIMEIENLEFLDAVRLLARRAGLAVPEQEDNYIRKSKERILELNRRAARYFFDNLSKPEGAAALKYIDKRGISAHIVKKFGLGAAPDSWDGLTAAMSAQGFEKSELVTAGLAVRGDGGRRVYDRFRNRLMFPIINVRGEIIGFGGRVLGEGEPKYLNSPDTAVFNKRRNLFALNIAKTTKEGRLILTEGYMDALTLHQAGFDCAVASLGTSLTQEHAQLISRYAKEAVIAYDSDEAGQSAAQRAIDILGKAGVAVKVLRMQGAKDPDEFIKKKGSDAFRLLLDRSENHIEYRLLSLKTKHNLSSDESRVEFLKEAAIMLSSLDNAVEREVYGARVAETAGVSTEAVKLEVKRAFAARMKKEKKKQDRRDLSPRTERLPKDRSIRYDNIKSALAEEGVLRLLMLDPTVFKGAEELAPEDFSSPFLGRAYGELMQRYLDGRSMSLSSLSGDFAKEEMAHLAAIMQKPESLSNATKALSDYINIIKNNFKYKEDKDLLEAWEKLKDKKGNGGR